jgi:dynein light intermediate chain 1
VQSSSTNKLPSNKSLLVLGDYKTGKTSLIAKMQGNEDPKKGSGLEFHYLLVRDEYRDEQTQLGAWVLDGDSSYQSLLRYALNERNFADTTILLVCSMSAPWDILQSLQSWAQVLESHIKNLRMEPNVLNAFRKQQLKRYLEYISPGDEIEGLVGSQIKQRLSDGDESNSIDPELAGEDSLDKDVLIHNLGFDIVVVVTKTDYMSTLEKDYDYKEEHFDFIQQAIRKFCIQCKFALSMKKRVFCFLN